MHKKSFASGIILLFLLSSLIPMVSSDTPTLNKTIYVDDDGGADYTRIQEAVDNANDGDTIYVFNGIYYENVFINKSIELMGENNEFTIIDCNRSIGDSVCLNSDNIIISGFTIKNSGKQKGDSGIRINSNYNIISKNIIIENGWTRYYYNQGGIFINESSYNTIENNIITENREAGIYLIKADNNTIQNNTIHNNGYLAIISNASTYNKIMKNDIYENYCGMTFWPYSKYNIIEKNYIHNHPGCGIAFKAYSDNNIIRNNQLINNLEWGIMLGFGPTKNNIIEYNTISGTLGGSQNWFDGSGLVLSIVYNNKIRFNNFIGNKNDVYLENSIFNIWRSNYWENYTGKGVKLIKGHFAKPYVYHPEFKIPWFAIDWYPAKKPYDIPEVI
jgi:parallel beta-helix repeat protein